MIASNALLNTDERSKETKQKEFLEKFVEYMSISAAAEAANIGRSTVYNWLKTDFIFRIEYEQAITVVGVAAENELVQRVFQGVAKQTFYRGQSMPDVKQYSDRLLLELLRARMPHRYGRDAKPTTDLPRPKLNDEELRQLSRALANGEVSTSDDYHPDFIKIDPYGADKTPENPAF